MSQQKVLLADGSFVPLSQFIKGRSLDSLDPFIWTTKKGEHLLVSLMATPHLFNSVRMLWNHTVPPAFRVGQFKRWPDVFGWDPEYKRDAMNAMLDEIADRDDLSTDEENQLDDMARNADVLGPLLQFSLSV